MKKLYCLAAAAIVTLSVCWYSPAQQAKLPEPLSDNASLEETGKWLIKALKKNFSFATNDRAGVYLIDDLKFDDCLLTFNLVREGLNTGSVAVIDTTTSSDGNKVKQDRIGTKVTAPLDPNTREPRIDVGTDPNHFPAPQGAPRPARNDRKIMDTQMFDLYEIDPAGFQILKMPQAPGVSYLLMVNRSVTEKGQVSVQAQAVRTEVRSGPRSATTGQVISQRPGGIISLKENSVAPIKAGFEHAIKLCQKL